MNTIFTGIATALITPFCGDAVDYEAFGKLIDWQIAQGIDALVICGTTGECSTLSDSEHRAVIEYAVSRVNGRVPVIAGTGSNDTAYAADLTRFCCQAGADAMLVVTPYYNKATQNGLVKMFNTIADASTKPLIVYNVPSRTGVNIEPATYALLAEHGNIAGIKEASGNISKIVETAALIGGKLDLYSGNDDQIVPILSIGGQGVISVLSNVAPRTAHDICQLYFDGKVKESAELQIAFMDLISALFSEVNPIPVKAAMNFLGYAAGPLRLPLTELEPEHQAALKAVMKKHGLLK